jgi:mono/diheme cytochrome c family protein
VVAGPQDFLAEIEISRGPEPESHQNPNWIGLHRDVFDQTCSNCHTTDNAGGTDNTSFCSNSACHGRAWDFAGFDAPALREVLLSQLPPPPTPGAPPSSGALTYQETVGLLLQERCGACHGSTGGIQGLDLTTYEGILQGGDSGPAIIPGDAPGSLVVIKQSGAQPHFGQLTPEELGLVFEWIAAGAPEN